MEFLMPSDPGTAAASAPANPFFCFWREPHWPRIRSLEARSQQACFVSLLYSQLLLHFPSIPERDDRSHDCQGTENANAYIKPSVALGNIRTSSQPC